MVNDTDHALPEFLSISHSLHVNILISDEEEEEENHETQRKFTSHRSLHIARPSLIEEEEETPFHDAIAQGPHSRDCLLSSPPVNTDTASIQITLGDGGRYWMKVSHDPYRKAPIVHDDGIARGGRLSNTLGLLRESVSTMKERLHESEVLLRNERLRREKEIEEEASEGKETSDVPSTIKSSNQLWVDKYAPKSFVNLLSSEQINREVLRLGNKYMRERCRTRCIDTYTIYLSISL